jgi:glutathione S-transferase
MLNVAITEEEAVTMKLYGHPMSTCTRKVLMTLAEKGREAELVQIDLMSGQQKSPEHLKRQPFGVVPVIEDEGFSLYESRAIIRYIDEKYSSTRLTPSDLQAKAKMEQWISVEHSYFTPAAMKIIIQKMFHPMRGQPVDQAVVEQGKTDTARTLDIMERALEGQQFLTGAQMTLADICYMPYIEYLFAAQEGGLITSRKNVAAWWSRLSERPTWKRIAGRA